MARPNIMNLRRVEQRHLGRLLNAEPYLQSIDDIIAEERYRVSSLLKLASVSCDQAEAAAACRLAQQLSCGLSTGTTPNSPASALFCHEWRLPAVEQLWMLVLEAGMPNCSAFTAMTSSWVIEAEQLDNFNPAHELERFRGNLNASGSAGTIGWVLAKFDCEFDPVNLLYRFHLHGIAALQKRDAVDGLRHMRKYRPNRSPRHLGRSIARPVQITRLPLDNLPFPLSYVLKCHFTSRWTGHVSGVAAVRRSNTPLRIPEPHHARILLWQHSRGLSDLILVQNLSVRNGQITSSNKH